MKRLLIFAGLLITTAGVFAQTTKPKTPAKPAAKPVAKAPTKMSFNDSVSYAIGFSAASFYKQQGLSKINSALVSQAISDVMNNKPVKMDENACNAVMNKAMSNILESKSQPNIDEGAAFLARNKSKAGVKTTASGLQYEVLREGTSDIRPTANDTFVCHYRGTLLNGTEFDASYNRGEPLVYPVGRVIKGWTEGLQLMTVGSKYKFYIPYDLAYGPSDNGPIPGGSTLVFEVELLDVKKFKE